MKQVLNVLFLIFLANILFAQAPQGIPYQAVARNSSGAILATTNISVRFTIRDSVSTGAIKYRETFSVTTTTQGMFNVNVGTGTVVIGTFSGINWGTNAKFMQVELDPAGGSSYIDMGTTQMMSVPYSLYSGASHTSSNCFTHYVGEVWGGGVIFNVYKDSDGIEHGLIVSPNDFDYFIWSDVNSTLIGTSAQSTWDGMSNSNAIVSQVGHTSSAAKLCLDLISGGFNDWYLPSMDELRKLSTMHFDINRSLSTVSGSNKLPQVAYYWSSTEFTNTDEVAYFAWAYNFEDARIIALDKSTYCKVRAIRSF